MITNLENIIKVIGFISAAYIFLQVIIPIIRNLIAQGIAGLLLVIIIFWWLFQKSK